MTRSRRRPEPELDRLSNILQRFNDLFGNTSWNDLDRVHRMITEHIPNQVAAVLLAVGKRGVLALKPRILSSPQLTRSQHVTGRSADALREDDALQVDVSH